VLGGSHHLKTFSFYWAPEKCLKLVGGFNPFEKYARQNGNLPQVGVKTKKYLKPPPLSKLSQDEPLLVVHGVTVQGPFLLAQVNGFHWGYFTAKCVEFFHPVGSMGLVYLPTILPSNQPFM